MKIFRCCLIFHILFFLSFTSLRGLEPTTVELTERAEWAAAKFDLTSPNIVEIVQRIVVVANHAPVQLDNRYGRPMKMGGDTYTNGLYCHAPSHLDIKLEQPATKFKAIIGIDDNENTSTGGGTVQFIVRIGNRDIFTSDIIRGPQAGLPIEVPLDNVREFSLIVTDAGDGISCDQSDWANAAVELADGTTLFLSSLPLIQEKESKTNETLYPFEFTYNGRSSHDFLPSWKKSVIQKQEGEKRYRTLIFDEPEGNLQVRCEAVEYLDFPTVEWTLYFKNTGREETPIIENILPIQTTFSREFFVPTNIAMFEPDYAETVRNNRQGEFLLHHFKGSPCSPDDYFLMETPLPPDASRDFLSAGRPMSIDSPYFNLQAGTRGWIIAIGWPGQWKASFLRDESCSTTVSAGQGTTHLKLLPGEEIRTPLIVVQNWKRSSWLEAQNVWRAWMIKYNVPRQPDGSFIGTHIAGCSSHWYGEMTQADEASQLHFIDRYIEEKIPLDYWWMDAGWYPCDGSWPKTGTWEVDKTRFPGGLRSITDYARRQGIKSIVWFEPERVRVDTWLMTQHPEWILPAENSESLLNLGNQEARIWLTEHVDSLIKSEGIDIYRQDFNMDPLVNWKNNDTPDRQGITELGHVTSYLAYWDALLERNPGLRIDSCASGGNRNDLETLRRSVPLWRSDYFLDPVGYQNQTLGISLWIPFHGTGWRALDAYGARSAMVPYLNLLYDLRDHSLDYDAIRSYLKTWKEIFVPLFAADFYPLTPFSERENPATPLDNQQDIWCGWQYNDPQTGKGAIQMFRRANAPYSVGTFRLHGLEPDALYTITDIDTGKTVDRSGKDLEKQGLEITINTVSSAVILTYEKK